MSTDTLADPTTGLDLGNDAVCTLKMVVNDEPVCDNPAAWACKLACCGHIKVVCEEHRDVVGSVAPKVFICTRCRATRPGIQSSWRI